MDSTSAAALQTRAYHTLTQYLLDHSDEVLNVEILPPAFPPPDGICMIEGPNLGLPKEILALAFLEARRRFLANYQDGPLSAPAYEATRLILLSDPEYLTAANFLKRRLQHLQSLPPPTSTHSQALYHDLTFLTTILTSPLHRQTKSPTLWHHRFFLATHLLPTLSASSVHAFTRSELSIICKSGERHPKNYYAFGYARRLFTLVEEREAAGEGGGCSTCSTKELLEDAAETMRSWCCSHPSDISGFSFLGYLLSQCSPSTNIIIVDRILSYALNLQIKNESLWVFVRGWVAAAMKDETGFPIVKRLEEWSEERSRTVSGEGDVLAGRVGQTLVYVETWGELSDSSKRAFGLVDEKGILILSEADDDVSH